MTHYAVIGAGVFGLTCACELVDRGVEVTVYEKAARIGDSACSWFAGGMLAPWCEGESADQVVVDLGMQASEWWRNHVSGVQQTGSLVLSLKRDQSGLKRFSKLTDQHSWLNAEQIGELEPDLAGRFEQALYFPEEAHLDPRAALRELGAYLQSKGGALVFDAEVDAEELTHQQGHQIVIDCRGFAAREDIQDLRGVKGEMLILHCPEIQLSRPVRLVHPRYPIYLVPRNDGLFMLGATMIENNERHRVSARSMLELLSAAYALHPGFGEAEIVEVGVDVRPAYSDNLPHISRRGKTIYANGLYRHGFLLGPAMAAKVADAAKDPSQFKTLPPL